MTKIKVGIIGLSGIVRKHCEAIQHLENVEVIAVADLLEERRNEYMSKYDIPRGYKNHLELLEDKEIDAVAITLGHHLHHRLTMDACNAKKHVLVEKPMALSLAQCDEMIKVAADNQVKLMVGLSQHFYGTSLKAKEIMNSGELGPIVSAVCYMNKRWMFEKRSPQWRSRYHGGGMWFGNGIHVVDRLCWVMASQAVSVSASIGTRSHYQSADDAASAFIRYKNGLSGHALAIGYESGGPIMECYVIGSRGSLRFAEHEEKFVKIGQGETWKDVPFNDPPAEMYHQWEAFADCIQNDLEPPTHGEWGRHILEIMLAAEQSSITNREVILESGLSYSHQTSGQVVTQKHGWI